MHNGSKMCVSYDTCTIMVFFLTFKDKPVFVHRGTDDDKKYFYVHPETGGVIQIGDLSELPDKTFQACFNLIDTCIYSNN